MRTVQDGKITLSTLARRDSRRYKTERVPGPKPPRTHTPMAPQHQPAGRPPQYPDSKWTEIAERNGRRITLIILSDPGQAISKASTQRILGQIQG